MKAAEQAGFPEYSTFLRAFQSTFHTSPKNFKCSKERSGQHCPVFFVILCQKALQNTLFRFFGGQTQRFQLQELVAGDLADGGLVDELGVRDSWRRWRGWTGYGPRP